MIRAVFTLLLILLFFTGQGWALDNPEQKIAEVIKSYIVTKYPGWSKDDLQITFKLAEKTFDGLRNLPEDASFRVLEVYPEFKPVGNVIFPLEVLSGENSKKIFLRAKVEALKEIVAAAKLIKKGKLLEASDFKLEKRDVALLPPKYFINSEVMVGKEAKITIPENSTLFEWMIGDLPLIRRGSEVTIIISAPGLSVKTKGEALEDGYQDAEIKVKRAESKKTIAGKVISPNEVEVKI